MGVAQTCPECGTRVSAYAAGCAVCGADLEAYARQRRLAEEAALASGAGGSEARRISLPRVRMPAIGLSAIDAVLLGVTLFFVLFVPFLGVLCAILGVMHGFYEDRRGLLVTYAVLGVIAAVLELSAL